MSTELPINQDNPLVPLDFLPHPELCKPWSLIDEEIKSDKERADEYYQSLEVWLDKVCTKEWRRKVLIIDLCLPNALDSFSTSTGFLIGRKIQKGEENTLIDRYNNSVIKLKGQNKSIGLNAVFAKGLVSLKSNNENIITPLTEKDMDKDLTNKSSSDLITQNVLYTSFINTHIDNYKCFFSSKYDSFEMKSIGSLGICMEKRFNDRC